MLHRNRLRKSWIFILSALFSGAVAQDFYDITTIPEIQLQFSQSNWYSLMTGNYSSGTNLIATVTVNGVTYDSVGVRFRGFTSYQNVKTQKKSFNIELDWLKDQDYLGYGEFNLTNCYEDPTFMREALYSNICRQLMPSAKVNFVKLTINGESWGLYSNVQQLDGRFIKEWFPSNDGTRWRAGATTGGGGGGGGGGGTSWGMTYYGGLILYSGTNDSTTFKKYYTLKSTKQDDPWADLINVCNILNKTTDAQLIEQLPAVLDIDRALWLIALELIYHDDDGYMYKGGGDYYLYYAPEDGRLNMIQFDANTCMSNANSQWSIFQRTDSYVPVKTRLLAIPQYRQRYLAHVRTIMNNYMNSTYMNARMDEYNTLINAEVSDDPKKLYTYSQYTSGITTLKNFVTNRYSYLSSKTSNAELNQSTPTILSVDKNIAYNGIRQTITITAQIDSNVACSAVNLFLSEGTFGAFTSQAMYDDGLHGDGSAGDYVYGVVLPEYSTGTTIRYYVQTIASNTYGSMAFYPECEAMASKHTVTIEQSNETPVVINEIMASNSKTIADPQGDYDDWIEFKNCSPDTVDMSGKYLTDDAAKPFAWEFPKEVKIAPNEYLVVWADNDENDEPGFHANFKLDADGDAVYLFDSAVNGNLLLDSVLFKRQYTDYSFNRMDDGTTWKVSAIATPGAANVFSKTSSIAVEVPSKYKLSPPYPNPFNSMTTISFELSQTKKIGIDIYDIRGRWVCRLVDRSYSAGSYKIKWNASGCANGIYFIAIKSNDAMTVQKVMLLK